MLCWSFAQTQGEAAAAPAPEKKEKPKKEPKEKKPAAEDGEERLDRSLRECAPLEK
jgi:hypothetical protein